MTRPTPAESEIYDRIRNAIAARTLLPGQRLREAELCRIFGASRGNVRKALARLAFDGLVDRQLNRGASVAQPSTKEAADLFAARACIETTIATEAARRLKPRDIARLETHIAREAKARDAGDQQLIVRLSGEFHMLVAGIAGNLVLQRFLADIIAQESLIIQLYERPGGQCCSHQDHARILQALTEGEPRAIEACIIEHIDAITAELDLHQIRVERPSLDEVLAK